MGLLYEEDGNGNKECNQGLPTDTLLELQGIKVILSQVQCCIPDQKMQFPY